MPATPTDENVLRAFYCATGGPNWKTKTGWGTAAFSGTNWHGVTVNSSSRVTRIDLRNNNLSGQIPASLNRLTSLRALVLRDNELTGPIPDLSALTDLRSLTLVGNKLNGPLPASLPSLISLTQFYLDNNELTGPIPDLSALTSLTQIGLSGNKLSGPVPASLNNLTGLTHLYLGQNELTGGIPDLSALTSLQVLGLNENHLTGLIPDLSALTSLTQIHLQHNLQLTGPIPDLSALTSLTQLHIQRNKLSGEIPTSLNALTNLTHLIIGNNQLSGEIPDLSGMTSLRVLAFQHNKLSGRIPASLSTLPSLTYLRLNHNQLTGPIPDLSALTGLTYLRLSNNKLTGGIPDLSALTGLKDLLLNDNQLSGPIPEAQLAALASLEDLGLWGNRGLTWSGNIPDRLRLRIERAALQLFYTETRYDVRGRTSWISRDGWSSGPKLSFGSWFGITTDSNGWVRRIDLSNNGLSNRLTGNFPTALEALASLERLDLSHNRDLTGTLPPGLRNLPLTVLNIRCTDLRVPGSLRSWLNGIFFSSGCPSSQYGVSFSANPNPVPWDGIGSITVHVYPEFQDVSVEINNSQGLCAWDDVFGNVLTFDIPEGWSEEEAFFHVVRHEGYYNGEGCEHYEDREEHQQCLEDQKKCFFDVSVSWTTGGERMTSSGKIVLPILPPSGSSAPTGTGGTPGGGGGLPPGGGGPPSGGGGPPPGGGGGGPPPAPQSSDASLNTLEVGEKSLDLDPDRDTYAVSTYGETSLTLTPTANHPDAEITVDGETVQSGTPYTVTLDDDGVTSIEIVVTAEDGTTRTYTLTVMSCPGEERKILEMFYDSTQGDMWEQSGGWNTEDDLRDWHGVRTDEDGRVISLSLPDNGLSGDIPSALKCFSELSGLSELALWDNEGLSREVPDDLVPAVERAVLRDVAEALSLNTQWFEDYEDPFDFEDWHSGVTTDEDGRVTELDFTGEDITGEIPGSVFELERLTALETGCEVTLEVEAPEGVRVMMADDCPEETPPEDMEEESGGGGCALGQRDSSVSTFGLFLVTLLVFAALGRRRVLG